MSHNFITPVSMQVTQEQYEKDLKEPLIKLGYDYLTLIDCTYSILLTNLLGKQGKLGKGDFSKKYCFNRYFINHYNPELFLALAAMTDRETPIVGEYIIAKSRQHVPYTPEKVLSILDGHYRTLSNNNKWESGLYRKATKEELIKHFTKMENTTPKTFAITGSKSLLKAMEEELVGVGFTNRAVEGRGDKFIVTDTPRFKNGIFWNKKQFSELYYYHDDNNADVIFQLPQQWEECIAFCKEQLELWDKPKFKVGDWVVIEDDSNSSTDKKANLTGKNRGYTFKIGFISNSIIEYVRKWVYEDNIDRGDGISIDQLRLATKEEIELAQKVKVGSYTMEEGKGYANFGCQSFTKEEVSTLKRFVGLGFSVSYENTKIDVELLNKILKKIE